MAQTEQHLQMQMSWISLNVPQSEFKAYNNTFEGVGLYCVAVQSQRAEGPGRSDTEKRLKGSFNCYGSMYQQRNLLSIKCVSSRGLQPLDCHFLLTML